MTRNWIFCASPAALVAGMMLMHCSSSSTTTSTVDSGTHSSSSASKSSSSAKSDAGTSSSKASSSAKPDAGTSSSALADAGNWAMGDYDASCSPTEGGLPCTPGQVSCGTATCNVPAQFCCDIPGTSETCTTAGGACAGTPVACDEAADCPTKGDICCIASQSTTSATVSCQRGPICPTAPVATAQICRSNTECASGKCQFWNCLGNVIQACTNPVPSLDLCKVSTSDGGTP